MKKELIKTDNYLLVVDNSEIQYDDHYVTWDNNYNPPKYEVYVLASGVNGENPKKIIAYLPLNDSPVLEGVMLLQPLEVEEDDMYTDAQEYAVNSGSPNRESRRKGFVDGYKKAREKYSLSNILDLYIKEKGYGMDMWSKEENETMTTIGNIIESLSQPKMPTHFEFEMVDYGHYEMGIDDFIKHGEKPKTITNAQGQEVACGKYIY